MLPADADLPVSPVKEDGLGEPFADAPAKGAGIAEDRPPDRARYPGQVFEAGQPMGGGEFNKIAQPGPGQGFDQSIIPDQGQAAGGILDDQPPVAGVIKKNISAAAYDEIVPAMPPRQTDGCFKFFRGSGLEKEVSRTPDPEARHLTQRDIPAQRFAQARFKKSWKFGHFRPPLF